ncbi:MAG TPA: hypothetical protein VGQ99_11105 [Tepidisphaeraceae bacterium]|nr:hypothetical protein [Tepidisphaeraceae bacterium]
MPSDFHFTFFALSGDLNRDRTVSISDFIDLSANFNKPLTLPAIPAPQPAAAEELTSSPASPSTDVLKKTSAPLFPRRPRHHHRLRHR